MKIFFVLVLLVLLPLTACVITPGPPGSGGITVTPLPAIIELGDDPYYYQNGYYYFFNNNEWRYSRSRSGPWSDLPRSYWPKEIRHKERDRNSDRRRDYDRDRQRDSDWDGDSRRDYDRR